MKKCIPVFICLLFLIGMAPQVFGETINFNYDTHVYWPGWQSTSTGSKNTDHYGTPDILGGTATITNGYLTNVTFTVKNTSPATWNFWQYLKPADLFIDTDNNGSWNYVVNMISPSGSLVVPDGRLYATTQDIDTSGSYFTAYVPGFGDSEIRAGHPIGVDVTGPSKSVNFSGWPTSPQLSIGGETIVSFGFGLQDILLDSEFAIGWTVNCANDVIYEQLNHQVPEPATLPLLGLGIIGLAVMGQKRFLAKQIG